MKLKFFWPALTLLVVLLILFLPAFLAVFIKYLPDYEQPPTNGSRKVNGAIVLSQSFTASQNGLSAIGLSIRNFTLINKKDLIMQVLDSNSLVVREIVTNGRIIDDGAFIRIRFAPIADSKNQQYTLKLVSPESQDNESLEIMTTQNACGNYGQFLVDEQFNDGGLAFVPFYTPQNRLMTVADVYSGVLKRLGSDMGFSVVYILGIGWVVGYLIYLNRKG